MGSAKGTLNTHDRNVIIFQAALGVVSTVLYITGVYPVLFGNYSTFVAVLLQVVGETLRRLLTGPSATAA